MKLIPMQEGIRYIEERIGIPPTHERIESGYYRNASPGERPPFKLEFEWNAPGEPAIDEDGLVSKQTIRAELDAQTGRLVAFYRHDHREEQAAEEMELDETLYEQVHAQAVAWMKRLGLPVAPEELDVRKRSFNGVRYELVYARTRDGYPVMGQWLRIDLNRDFELLHLAFQWEEAEFPALTSLLAPEALFDRLDEGLLSPLYIRMLTPSTHPVYTIRENVYDATSGELLQTDGPDRVDYIDLSPGSPDISQIMIMNPGQPSRQGHHDELRLKEDWTEADLLAPHPFDPMLPDEMVEHAKETAVSALREALPDGPCEYAFVSGSSQEPVTMRPNGQIQVVIHRLLHGIPIVGGKLVYFLDSRTGACTGQMDAMGVFTADDGTTLADLLEPKLPAEEAWKRLSGKLSITAAYHIQPGGVEVGPRQAVLAYTTSSEWVCDAVSGELRELD